MFFFTVRPIFRQIFMFWMISWWMILPPLSFKSIKNTTFLLCFYFIALSTTPIVHFIIALTFYLFIEYRILIIIIRKKTCYFFTVSDFFWGGQYYYNYYSCGWKITLIRMRCYTTHPYTPPHPHTQSWCFGLLQSFISAM